MSNRFAAMRPTLELLLDLCARLRLACEAVGPTGVSPADVSLDDVSPAERARLRQLAQGDLWTLINQSNEPVAKRTLPKPKRRRVYAIRRSA